MSENFFGKKLPVINMGEIGTNVDSINIGECYTIYSKYENSMGEIKSNGIYRDYICVGKKNNQYEQLELSFMNKDGKIFTHTKNDTSYPTQFYDEVCSPELSQIYNDRVKLFSKEGGRRKNRRRTKRARRNRRRSSRRN
jgi:hypothetical protein